MLKAQGAARPPDELHHYERTVTMLTDAIGSDVLGRARAAGRSMTPSEAVDFALGARSAG